MRKPPKLSLLDRLRIKKVLRKPPKLSVCWYTEGHLEKPLRADGAQGAPQRIPETYQIDRRGVSEDATPRSVRAVGFSRCPEEEWVKIKAEAVDPECFEATYQDWLNMANEAFDDLQKTGLSPLKVLVVADELRQWCHINGRKTILLLGHCSRWNCLVKTERSLCNLPNDVVVSREVYIRRMTHALMRPT